MAYRTTASSVFFMAAGPLRAGVVQQALADVPPDRVQTIQPDSIGLLDLDDSPAAAAAHPSKREEFGSAPWARLPAVGTRVIQQHLPVFWRQSFIRSKPAFRRRAPTGVACHLFLFGASACANLQGAIGHA